MTVPAFVSMPFGDNPDSPECEWTKLYEHALLPLQENPEGDADYPGLELLRADRSLLGLQLKANVRNNIDKASFVIAVLTTQRLGDEGSTKVSNPNVLWEIGYAEAQGKPVVMLVDQAQDLRALPVLTSEYVVFPYSHDLVQSCPVKDAADVLAVITRNMREPVKMAHRKARENLRSSAWVRPVAYTNRDDVPLAEMISRARRVVEVLSTNVDYYLSRSFYSGPAATHPFASALRNGAMLTVVTMDPESLIAEYRAKQLHRGADVPGYRKELRDGIRLLFQLHKDDERFSMHLYNDLPLQITVRIDETIVTSVVTRGSRARLSIQTQFDLGFFPTADSFVSHFQTMYDGSEDVRSFRWATAAPDAGLLERLQDPFGAEDTPNVGPLPRGKAGAADRDLTRPSPPHEK